jgi:hypothetical protein
VPIKTVLEAPSISADKAQIFDFDARLLFRVVSQMRASARIPASSVTAVLTDDFDDGRAFGRRFVDAGI